MCAGVCVCVCVCMCLSVCMLCAYVDKEMRQCEMCTRVCASDVMCGVDELRMTRV